MNVFDHANCDVALFCRLSIVNIRRLNVQVCLHYTIQTRDQQRFTISEVGSGSWLSWATANGTAALTDNWTHGHDAAGRHTIAPISHTLYPVAQYRQFTTLHVFSRCLRQFSYPTGEERRDAACSLLSTIPQYRLKQGVWRVCVSVILSIILHCKATCTLCWRCINQVLQ